MGAKTKIGWTEATWNWITGCTKLSAGCKFCYVERIWPRLAGNNKTIYFGRQFADVRFHPSELGMPAQLTRPRMIFVNSMSDTFHSGVPDEVIDQGFAAMVLAGQHTYQVLTKRIERAVEYLSAPGRKEKIQAAVRKLLESGNEAFRGHTFTGDIQWPLPNVWIGTTVEDQKAANERIWQLFKAPAAVRYISVEPLIGAVNLQEVRAEDGSMMNALDGDVRLDWVIIGCESGSQRRKLDIDWVRALMRACLKYGVPFFLKQLFQNGKIVSEPLLDGRQWVDFPGAERQQLAKAA